MFHDKVTLSNNTSTFCIIRKECFPGLGNFERVNLEHSRLVSDRFCRLPQVAPVRPEKGTGVVSNRVSPKLVDEYRYTWEFSVTNTSRGGFRGKHPILAVLFHNETMSCSSRFSHSRLRFRIDVVRQNGHAKSVFLGCTLSKRRN